MSDGSPTSSAHERILAAATRLFLEGGIRAVSIERIIAEARVAQMTPYRQFGSKDQLVAAVLEQFGVGLLQSLNLRLERCGDDSAVRLAVATEWAVTDGHPGPLVLSAATELRGEPDHPAHSVIAAHQQAVRQQLEDLAKLVGADAPMELAAQLHLVLEGAVATAVVDRRPPSAATVGAVADAVLEAHVPGARRHRRAVQPP
jgi:AcrR family transcriptional regulator